MCGGSGGGGEKRGRGREEGFLLFCFFLPLFALHSRHMSFAGGQLVIQTGLTQKEQNEMFLLAAARHLTNQLSLACSECPRENEAVTGWPIGRSI